MARHPGDVTQHPLNSKHFWPSPAHQLSVSRRRELWSCRASRENGPSTSRNTRCGVSHCLLSLPPQEKKSKRFLDVPRDLELPIHRHWSLFLYCIFYITLWKKTMSGFRCRSHLAVLTLPLSRCCDNGNVPLLVVTLQL